MPQLEIAIETLADAVAAQQGGADSIEISRDLSVGGLTPDFALVRRIRETVQIEVNVIVRPHARDFVYTEHEIAQILEDTRTLTQLDVDGVVFGALRSDRRLDLELVRRVAQAAAPLPLTVHRALDESFEPEQALTGLIGIAPRVLTSGPAASAWEGRIALAHWVRDYGDRLRFIAAGSLTPEMLPEMIRMVRTHGYHFGSAARKGGIVDADKVRALRALVIR